MPEVVLDTRTMEAFEVGAAIRSIVACPGLDEADLRQQMMRAWCSEIGQLSCVAGTFSDAEWALNFPSYNLSQREIRAALRTAPGRLEARSVAARMARGFIWESISGLPANMPDTMDRHSVAELAKLVQLETGEGHSTNVKKRTWRNSRPVLHLAAAIDVVTEAMQKSAFPAPPPDPLHDPEHNVRVIAVATVYEEAIRLNPQKFRFSADKLIRVRLKF